MCEAPIILPGAETWLRSTEFYFHFTNTITVSKSQTSKLRFRETSLFVLNRNWQVTDLGRARHLETGWCNYQATIQITKLCLKEMLCLGGRHFGLCPRSPKTMNSLAPFAFRGKWSGSPSTVNTLLSLCLLEWKVFIWPNQSVIQTNSSVNWECQALVTCLTSCPLPVHYHSLWQQPLPLSFIWPPPVFFSW